jgi:GNAT superfamily N-acetyltransferase
VTGHSASGSPGGVLTWPPPSARATRPCPEGLAVRAPASGDRARIGSMWERCGALTRVGRFHAPVRHIPVSYLDAVLADPDASAIAGPAGTEAVIGVASLFREGSDGTAELGVLIEDAWQCCGIGRLLVSRLLQHAPSRGITVLTASVLARNEAAVNLLRRIPGTYSATITGTTVQVRVRLAPPRIRPGGPSATCQQTLRVDPADHGWQHDVAGPPAGARTAPGSGSSGDHIYSHRAWPDPRQGLAGLLAGYPVTSSAR